MKRLRFESLELLSLKERKARRVKFHPRLTVIQGANDVGKSSVIKSLYWTFGAAAAVIHPKWADANIKALVTFTIDDVLYRIVRDNNTFGIFDADDSPLLITTQITKELGPFLARLLDFGLVLSSRIGEPETPSPAYAFLPFYLDQDGGWQNTLASFANLSQYAGFKKPVLEFHTGILPNEYYELEAQKRKVQVSQREFEADRRIVSKAIERFDLEASFDGLELSLEGHEEAIEGLLKRLQSLRLTRQERAMTLAEILDQRMVLDQQVQVVRASIGELGKDMVFAGDLPEEVYCPTCGTVHRNDFAHRYGIVDDREACFEFISEARQRDTKLAAQAAKAELELRETDGTLSEIQASLDKKQGEVTLMQVIDSRGQRIASDLFERQHKTLTDQINDILGRVAEIDDQLKTLRNKRRRDEIVQFYAGFILRYLERLDVANFSADAFTKIPAKVSETGSDLPRAILAHFLAILQTVNKFSTSFFAPIVVDSPNQQDQDATNVAKMIALIVAERPKDAQTILGTVSSHGQVVEDSKVIEFEEKLSVLIEAEYPEVSETMRPYLSRLIG
jgi:hypothetical protein